MGLFSFIGDIIGDITGASGVESAAQESAEDTRETARRAEALNRERYQLAQGYMTPFVGRSDIASRQMMAEMGLPQYQSPQTTQQTTQQAGAGRDFEIGPDGEIYQLATASPDPQGPAGFDPYMSNADQEYAPRELSQIPGYQAVMDESLRAAEQSAVSSGSTAYGGRRLKAAGEVGAGVQQSYYNNYMNMLQNLASPTTATNLSSMGMNQGIAMGQQNIAATGMANQYMMEGAGARQAGFADLMGGISNVASGAFSGGYI